MNTRFKLFIVTLLFAVTTAAAETAVIVHPSNSASIDRDAINKIFLGKSQSFSDGTGATPINQKDGSPIRSAFDKNVLDKTSSQVKAYWSKLMFTGKGTPPEEQAGDAAVKTAVAGDSGAIGYIDASQVDDSVKVVLSF
ncbi:substrate-binding domain-containing protein [Teredinibacter turnerae]|uniref:substrate-binding domain-containing protein n=1 Tax=Teredinibacter turnerae TaxID=2426 RepID=UPI00037CFE53|nr:substrate-binding domain-containing protein [Teredinibacter turnerae]